MVYFSPATKEITAKIVYYGPGMCGKTTNLQKVHELMRPQMKTELVSVATETDRTIYFDFLPVKLGKIAGFDFVVRSFTVPGQPYYAETRKMVLQGADGVVFVADSQRYMLDQNKDSLIDLKKNLKLNGLDYHSIPLILQYNKRDLPDLLSVDDLDAALNDRRVQTFQASAFQGTGVVETLKAITMTVFKHVRDGGLANLAPPPGTNASRPSVRPMESQTGAPVTSSPVPHGSATPAPVTGARPVTSATPMPQASLPRPPTTASGAATRAPSGAVARPASGGYQRPASGAYATQPGVQTNSQPPTSAIAGLVQQVVQNAEQGSAPMPSKDAIGHLEFQNMAVLHHRLTERVAQLEKELHRLAQEHQDLKRIVGKKLM